MQIDIEGLKHNRIMARARGNYELYLLVRQMVNELNQGIKRYSCEQQTLDDTYIAGCLNCQKNDRIETHSRVFVRGHGESGVVVHTIKVNSIK